MQLELSTGKCRLWNFPPQKVLYEFSFQKVLVLDLTDVYNNVGRQKALRDLNFILILPRHVS